jgi:hypothetical protein
MLPIQIATAIVINNNVHRAISGVNRTRLGIGAGGFVEHRIVLTPLGQKCMDLVKQDREAMRSVIYQQRVAELKARGITRPGDIMKYTYDMFGGKVRW